MQQQFPTSTPVAAHQGPPASATPIADYCRGRPPGLTPDGRYLVIPVDLLAGMELPWQQQVSQLMTAFWQRHGQAPWPTYRVIPTRPMRMTDCSEEQLAEVGVLAEYDDNDTLVYRDRRTLEPIDAPEERTVFVSCVDRLVGAPIPPRQAR